MNRTPFAQMKLDFDKFMSSPEASMDTSTYFLKPDPAKTKTQHNSQRSVKFADTYIGTRVRRVKRKREPRENCSL